MSIDMETQVRAYADFLDSTLPVLEAGDAMVERIGDVPELELDDVRATDHRSRRLPTDRPIRRQTRLRPVVVVVVAVFLTLFLVGAVGIIGLLGGGDTDVIDAPPNLETTLITVATTQPPVETTLPLGAPIPGQGTFAVGNSGLATGPWVFSNEAGVPSAFVTWFEVGDPPVLHVDVVECASDDCSVMVRTRLEGLTGVEPWPLSQPLLLSEGSRAWVSGPELVICDDAVCSKASRVTLGGDVGGGNVALADDGRPVFVLALAKSPGAAIVVCGDARCETGSSVVAILDDAWVPIPYSALAIHEGRLAYAYRNPDSAALYLVTCSDLECESPVTVEVVPPHSGKSWPDVLSLAVGSDGLPVLVHGLMGEPRQLWVVHCENWACSESNDAAVSELHGLWQGPSLAIGSDGNPVMAFQSNDRITVLKCEDVACARTTISRPLGETPGDPSLVIGSDGLPIIAYFPPGPVEIDDEDFSEPPAGTELVGGAPVLFRCADLACTGPVIRQ